MDKKTLSILIKENEQFESYSNFCDIDLSNSVNNAKKVERNGFDLYIPTDCNNDKKGYFIIDSKNGHDCYSYDKESTSSYYVLEGNGKFIINAAEIIVKKGSTIVIPPCVTFYYDGCMEMILKMEPNFKEENFCLVKEVVYDNKSCE